MKKLLVLSVLLGLLALPMFASDITFGGDATFGFLTDFSGDAETEKADLTFDVKAAIDDFNSLTINMDGLEYNVLAAKGGDLTKTLEISKALVTTDVGKWLGLPVGVKVNWGYDDPDWNGYAAISSYDNLSSNLSPDEYWGVDFLISWNILEFELAMNPQVSNTEVGYLLAGVAVKEPIKGLNAEVYYFQNKAVDTYGDGTIALDAAYAAEVAGFSITAAPAFFYNMSDVGDAWKWYFALKGKYGMFAVDTELAGNETDAFAAMDAVAKVSPIDKVDIYAGMQLSFVDGTDAFQGADLGVAAKMGATTAYVGYLVTSNGAKDINGYFGLPDGGFYVAFDVNY